MSISEVLEEDTAHWLETNFISASAHNIDEVSLVRLWYTALLLLGTLVCPEKQRGERHCLVEYPQNIPTDVEREPHQVIMGDDEIYSVAQTQHNFIRSWTFAEERRAFVYRLTKLLEHSFNSENIVNCVSRRGYSKVSSRVSPRSLSVTPSIVLWVSWDRLQQLVSIVSACATEHGTKLHRQCGRKLESRHAVNGRAQLQHIWLTRKYRSRHG